MSDADDMSIEPRAPRETTVLHGQGEAERGLLEAYRGRRFHHAWLIAGPAGIGKATLAYRMARFVLAHGEASSPAVREAGSLAVDSAHAVARQVAGQTPLDAFAPLRAPHSSWPR